MLWQWSEDMVGFFHEQYVHASSCCHTWKMYAGKQNTMLTAWLSWIEWMKLHPFLLYILYFILINPGINFHRIQRARGDPTFFAKVYIIIYKCITIGLAPPPFFFF
jgi:hypothetical protein